LIAIALGHGIPLRYGSWDLREALFADFGAASAVAMAALRFELVTGVLLAADPLSPNS
jgi:hypothetical protein